MSLPGVKGTGVDRTVLVLGEHASREQFHTEELVEEEWRHNGTRPHLRPEQVL